MKASTGFQVMSPKQPVLVISEQLLKSVQHLVRRSALEAQWFHTVQRIENDKKIFFVLDQLLIPKQYVSGATVETPPEFQVEYWNDLVAKFGDQASEIVRTSGAWCHSHVNMQATPSGTDNTTFAEHCVEARKTGNTTPQLMLIFNKKDEYYSRVWDPETNLVFEGLELAITEDNDWTALDKETDSRFLSRPVLASAPPFSNRQTTQSVGPGKGTSLVKTGRATPVEVTRKDYSKLFDDLEQYRLSGLAEDLTPIRDMLDKYLSSYYYYPLFAMAFGDVPQIKRLASKFFLVKDFHMNVGKSAQVNFWAYINQREYSTERLTIALDRTVDLAASASPIEAGEIVNGFLEDADLVQTSDATAYGRD